MNSFAVAARANLAVLEQGLGLLHLLGSERYAARVPLCFNSSVGGHLRHVLEHYEAFLVGLAGGALDYESRARDVRVEQDLAFATERLESVARRLTELAIECDDGPLAVIAETSPGIAVRSSSVRELEFLLSHSIHHYALIAVIARSLGCEPAADFGMAPSTLKHLQRNPAACAR